MFVLICYLLFSKYENIENLIPNTLSATIGENKSDQNQNKISTQIRIITQSSHINHPCNHTCEAMKPSHKTCSSFQRKRVWTEASRAAGGGTV